MFSYTEKNEADVLKKGLTKFLMDHIEKEIQEETFMLRYEDWADEWMVYSHPSPRVREVMNSYRDKTLREDVVAYFKERTSFCLKKTESSLDLFTIKYISDKLKRHVKLHTPVYVTGSLQTGWRDSFFSNIDALYEENPLYLADTKNDFICIGPLKTDQKADFNSMEMADVLFVWIERFDPEALIEIGIAYQMKKHIFLGSPKPITGFRKLVYEPFLEHQYASTPEQAWDLFVSWYGKKFPKSAQGHEVTSSMKSFLKSLLYPNKTKLLCSINDLSFYEVQQLIGYFHKREIVLPLSLSKKIKKLNKQRVSKG